MKRYTLAAAAFTAPWLAGYAAGVDAPVWVTFCAILASVAIDAIRDKARAAQ